MTVHSGQYDPQFLRLLGFAPFVRRRGGGWRFGTKTISDIVVDRLIASGAAAIDGELLHLVRAEAIT